MSWNELSASELATRIALEEIYAADVSHGVTAEAFGGVGKEEIAQVRAHAEPAPSRRVTPNAVTHVFELLFDSWRQMAAARLMATRMSIWLCGASRRCVGSRLAGRTFSSTWALAMAGW